ncbi:hypothetical protein L1049_019582 [Liquidambar formosana]|uniref:Uncharacterized protein n=1 Tax=Liquidambar formosana TaxID=63359 RepID=A0AAP0S5Z1_LIQFO
MVAFDHVSPNFWKSLGLLLVAVNDRGFLLPTMWVLCAYHFNPPMIIQNSSQQITIQVCIDLVLALLLLSMLPLHRLREESYGRGLCTCALLFLVLGWQWGISMLL